MDDLRLTIPLTDFLELEPAAAGRVVEARYEALRAAGCDAESAVVGAAHPEFELGDVVNLSRRNVAPRTMIAILLDRPVAAPPGAEAAASALHARVGLSSSTELLHQSRA